MRPAVALFAVIALAALVGVSVWATGHQSIGLAIHDLADNPAGGNNPWFWATLFDAYFAFLWFWLWVAYKEPNWLAKVVWLLLILALGNIGMAVYVLIQLWRLPAGASMSQLLLRRPSA